MMNQRPAGTAGKLLLAVALAALTLAASGCTKLRARDQLNKGVQAYKANKFETAVNHFQNAINLDPQLNVAKLYLATACAAQYAPGVEDASNVRWADCALENFKRVLDSNPDQTQKVLSIKGIASLYYNQKKFEEAKQWHQKAIDADPNDPENYYSLAVIDWTQSYAPRTEARLKMGLTDPTKPITDKKECQSLADAHMAQVDEGINMLTKAIDLRKDYDDAMAYLNLLYRERADYRCGDAEARAADLKLADEMVEKAKTTRQSKADKAKEQKGIILEQPTSGSTNQ
jgi:tetratricopeptide (TPR) repeat protein